MSKTRTLQRVQDPEQQDLETMRYWQSRPVGERLTAVWDLSEAAYSFTASFRGIRTDDAEDLRDLLSAFNEQRVR